MAGVRSEEEKQEEEEEAVEEPRDEGNSWEHDLSRDSSFVSARTSLSSCRTSSLPYDEVTIRSDFSLGRHIGSGDIEEKTDYRYLPFSPSTRLTAPGTTPITNIFHLKAPPRGWNANTNHREWKVRKRIGSLWIFSKEEIRKATNNFDERQQLIKWWCQSTLYKGTMPEFLQPVTLHPIGDLEGRKSFDEMVFEICVLSRIRHKNIAKPIGVCFDGKPSYSVYEFYPNGSLYESLFYGHMPWEMRLKVATEVAGALTYLHSSLGAPIVHRDINAACIYLDANYTTKICHFITAKSVPRDQTHITTRLCGTFGYLDPEYLHTQQLTCKTAVYSFGVILVVLLTRRRPFDFKGNESLVSLFISSMEGSTLEDILDADVANANTLDEMRLVARLAAECLEPRSKDRPTMQEVTIALENIRKADSSPSHVDLTPTQTSICNDTLYSEYINSASWSTSYVNNSNAGIYSKLLRWLQNRQKRKAHSLAKKFLKYRNDIGDNWERCKIYTIRELMVATNNFDDSQILSKGKNIVYEGILADGTRCAIKKPTDYSSAEEILNEINFLPQLRHKNIVGLLGFCFEAKFPTTIHEYMTNGPLSWKIQNKSISWESRLMISRQIAEALSYLHTSISSPIIHGDVKSSNILLDDDNTAKLSDFGVASILGMDDENHFLVHGTPGYIDPEYHHTGRISCKSDVYSFGVVLAQLITGQTAIFKEDNIGSVSLAEYFVQLMDKNLLEQYIDENIADNAFIDQIKVVANLALKCLSFKAEERPSMIEVAMNLQLVQREIENDEDIIPFATYPPDEAYDEIVTPR